MYRWGGIPEIAGKVAEVFGITNQSIPERGTILIAIHISLPDTVATRDDQQSNQSILPGISEW